MTSEHTPSRFEFCASSETGDLVTKINAIIAVFHATFKPGNFAIKNKIDLHKIKETICTLMHISLTWFVCAQLCRFAMIYAYLDRGQIFAL